jgi:hypothetical protein
VSNCTFPRKNSIAARILARLLKGEQLKHREADALTGSYRLSGYIHYLEKQHRWIISRREETEPTRDPIRRDSSFTLYWLSNEQIKWMGEEGQIFADEVLRWETEKRIG